MRVAQPGRSTLALLSLVVVLAVSSIGCTERSADGANASAGSDRPSATSDSTTDGTNGGATTATTVLELVDPGEVSLAGMEEHLVNLQAIADANGGTRAVGTPGYDASVAYVQQRLQQAGYEVQIEEFRIPAAAAAYAEGHPVPPSSVNVVAESDRAPGNEVVMVGGHLDSVFTGPGINDNGSGVAAILELAEWLADQEGELEVDVRFGFWGAEELGLIGSSAYVRGLDDDEIDDVLAYVNLDMIGSSNGGRFVYDPAAAIDRSTTSPGSSAITEQFEAYFDVRDLTYQPVWTDGRSDEATFAMAGVPVGGLFSGAEAPKTQVEELLFGGTAGEPLAPCYHSACDVVTDIDRELMDQLAQAFGVVTIELAVDPSPVRLRSGG